jgi:IclR family transcriptional regulator, acetate operon repressor
MEICPTDAEATMNGILERTLGILEYLATHADGVPMATIADEMGIPRSAAHRLLADLARFGYVRQTRKHGDYVLTTKLASLGLIHLSGTGVVDIAQPLLDRLAETSGELVRLSVVDGDRLTWVARAQGAMRGLRYDPDMGMDAKLSCTATGHAWLLTMADDEALQRVSRQGFGAPADYGPNAPTTVRALLKFVHAARSRGFSMIDEVFAPAMTAMAAPVVRKDNLAIGVISIAGPKVRLTEKRMTKLGPALLEAAAELAASSKASMHFRDRPLGRS